MDINELTQEFLGKDGKITYCPLSAVRGFPIDWNPGGRDPFVMSPQYPDILQKILDSRREYKERESE